MGKVIHFVLEKYDYGEYQGATIVKAPKALEAEVSDYITAHTEYSILLVAEAVAAHTGEIMPLREFLAHEMEEAIKHLGYKLWLEDRDLYRNDLRALAEKGEWERITNLLLEIKSREFKAAAPYRIYTIPAHTQSFSGDLPSGSEIVVDRETAAKMDEESLGREVPIEELLAGEYGDFGKIVGDVAHRYTEGRKILDRLAELEGEENEHRV